MKRINHRQRILTASADTSAAGPSTSSSSSAAATVQTGYSIDIFCNTDLLRSDSCPFLCTREACRNVMKEPTQAHCGHRYCKECIAILENSQQDEKYCRGCVLEAMDVDIKNAAPDYERFPFIADRTMIDKAVLKDINSLPTYCRYPSCVEKMQLLRREEHIAICQHRPAKCRMCGAEVTAAEQINHESNECPLRMVTCDFGCKSTMRAQDLPEHKANSCPSRQTVCHICHTSIPHGEETEHFSNYCTVDVCPLGCQETVSGKLLMEHFADSSLQSIHMRGLVEKCHNLQLLLEQQPSSEWQQDAVLTADRLLQLECSIDAVINRINNFMEQILVGQSTLPLEVTAGNLNSVLAFARTFQKAEVKVEELDILLQRIARDVNLMMGFETTFVDVQNKTERFRTRIDTKMTELDKSLHMREAETVEQKMLFSDLQQSADNGILVWKISNVTREHEQAKNGVKHSIFSPPFKSSVYGYRMCLRVYLNGDGQGRNTHLSMFFCVMRGEYDALLPWPFKQKVAMGLCSQVDSSRHIWERFKPDPSSSSFQRPRTEMNVASGAPKFADLENILDSSKGYMKDDAIFILAKVESVVPDAIHDVGASVNVTHQVEEL